MQREHHEGVDRVERRHCKASDIDASNAFEDRVEVDRDVLAVVPGVEHVPMHVELDRTGSHRELGRSIPPGERPVAGDVLVAEVLQDLDRDGEIARVDQQVEITVRTRARIPVGMRGEHRALHHEPSDADIVEPSRDRSERTEYDEMAHGSQSVRRTEPRAHLLGHAIDAVEADADGAGQPVEIGEIGDTCECRGGDDVERYLVVRATEARGSVAGQLERTVIGRPSPEQPTHRRHGIQCACAARNGRSR